MLKKYDVLLRYRHHNRRIVRDVYRELKQRGITPWLDEVDVVPGKLSKTEFNRVASYTKTIAIFIGKEGFTDPQADEIKTIVAECSLNDIRIIPVILDDFEELHRNLAFLSIFYPVRFHDYSEMEASLQRLQFSILEKNEEYKKAQIETAEGTHISKARALMGPDKDQYRKLNSLLHAQDFQKASEETERCFKRILKKAEGINYIKTEEISEIPCDVLRIIDCLWLHHSDERFGFSLQRVIYARCGGTFDFNYLSTAAWNEFGKRVGWQQQGDWFLPADIQDKIKNPPKGHYPYWHIFLGKGALLHRLNSCGI